MNSAAPPSARPLVSILIPTHNRPDYLELAVKSALAQTYEHIEVVISDNGDNDDSTRMLAPYMAHDPRIKYHKIPSCGAMENFLNALNSSQGEYVNFLMDDDLFHPTKIERMLHYYLNYQNIGLVTSFRQLIDDHGAPIPPLPATRKLFEADTVINGSSLGDFVLRNGINVIGEPTTVLIRRADIGDSFGWFCGTQYNVLSDLGTWMSLMANRFCVYLAEPLSSFRLHAAQDQRNNGIALKANIEWLRLLLDGHANGLFITDEQEFRQQLSAKLSNLVPFLANHHEEIRRGSYDVPAIQALIARALGMLLGQNAR